MQIKGYLDVIGEHAKLQMQGNAASAVAAVATAMKV